MYLKSAEVFLSFILIAEILHRTESKKELTENGPKTRNNLTVSNNSSSLIPVENFPTHFKNSTLNPLQKKRKKKRRKRKKYSTISSLFSANQTLISTTPTGILPKSEKKTKKKPNKKRNRCEKNNGGCSQICRPKSKRKCFCKPGYKQAKNPKKCIDVNECKENNKGGCEDICVNIPGSYYCSCSPGLTLTDNLKSCRDINECLLRNGHGPCQDTCRNTHGSYICDCSSWNGTRLGVDGHSCIDIDECVEGNAGCSHNCINTFGGAFCSCPEGFLLSSDRKTCKDVNECEDAIIRKSCEFDCVNTLGSYYCSNRTEIQNDQTNTKLIRCPKLYPSTHHGFIKCFREKNVKSRIFNKPGTVCKLICRTGYQLSGSYYVTCSKFGRWLGSRSGMCLKAPKPLLNCPGNQEILLADNQTTLDVWFSKPKTNLQWKYLKANPEWAINLNGKLSEGYHVISFLATDPVTNHISTCSFSITVKRKID